MYEYFEKFIKEKAPLCPDDSSRVGLLGEVHSEWQGLYLADCGENKISLFFFDPQDNTDSLNVMLAKLNTVSRLNLEMLEAIKLGETGLDPEASAELVDMLIESLPERLNKLGLAINKTNWDEIRSQAHYLKSSFGVMGLERLSWLMTALEVAAKTQEQSTAKATYELTYPELVFALRFLRKEFGNQESIDAESVSVSDGTPRKILKKFE